jgi:cephalosporin hydroxylase
MRSMTLCIALLSLVLQFVSHVHGASRSDLLAMPQVVRNFIEYYLDSDPSRPYQMRFMGIPVWQNPADMWAVQEIIYEVRPDYIVEMGTGHGGSALYYATVLDRVNPAGRVITVDIDPKVKDYAKELSQRFDVFRDKVDVVVWDSSSPELLTHLRGTTRGKAVLVILDSYHGNEHVLQELRLYSQLVSPGSYIIVNDTIIDLKPEWIDRYVRRFAPPTDHSVGGPALAVERFLKENKSFHVDRGPEKFLLTFYPGGYLRKSL